MSRRRRAKSNNKPTILTIIAVGAILLLFWLVKDGFSGLGGDSSCGNREADPERDGYCLTTSADFDELVIVTGNTQNSPAPNLDFTKDKLREILSGVFYNTDRGVTPNISIVSASGDNRVIDYKAKYKAAQNIIASNNELKKLGKELNGAIKNSPSEAGANYLGAILEANNLFTSAAKNPVIVVVGSGLSDSGALNFASDELINQYWSNPDNIVNILSQNRRIREGVLGKATIYWYNIGDVVSPQASMNDYKEDIKSIYETAFNYLGATKLHLNNYTGVASDAKSVDSKYSVQQTYVDELKVGDVFDVNENIGRFYPDQSTLINPAEVEDKLAPFAKRFNVNGKTKLKLVGYIAFCVDDGQLGLARANTIKGILMKFGIPNHKIDTHGERGSPPEKANETYTCNSSLPETERRTVRIEVIKE